MIRTAYVRRDEVLKLLEVPLYKGDDSLGVEYQAGYNNMVEATMVMLEGVRSGIRGLNYIETNLIPNLHPHKGAAMTTISNEQLREKLEALYSEAIMMGVLRTGSPITHMVDGTMQLFASQRQAILKEVRERVIGVSLVPDDNNSREQLRAEQRIKLDAIERKYE